MTVKSILKKVDFSCPEEDVKTITEESKEIVRLVKEGIKKNRIKAEVFIGGSYAKGTLVKSSEYDVDIFVRFHKDGKISDELEKVIRKQKLEKAERVHGSRDYFRIKKGRFLFELIPVRKIARPKDMENVTDLSYFHVNYVKRKIKKNLSGEIALAKAFCKAQGVYGAESYIQGFSGYALECLIIQYKSFEKMLRELAKSKEQIILDPEKFYKNKNDIKVNLNQSRLQSPVVLVDPTWKERNVLAALSNETFARFKNSAKEFLKNPSEDFFKIKKTDSEEMKKEAKGKEFSHVRINTDRQEGDIAGTKMKKFSEFLIAEIKKYFEVEKKEFNYNEKKSSDLFVIAKSKGELLKQGPPVSLEMKRADEAFKAANKNVVEKDGRLWAKIKVNYSLSEFIKKFKEKEGRKIKEMGITKLEVL